MSTFTSPSWPFLAFSVKPQLSMGELVLVWCAQRTFLIMWCILLQNSLKTKEDAHDAFSRKVTWISRTLSSSDPTSLITILQNKRDKKFKNRLLKADGSLASEDARCGGHVHPLLLHLWPISVPPSSNKSGTTRTAHDWGLPDLHLFTTQQKPTPNTLTPAHEGKIYQTSKWLTKVVQNIRTHSKLFRLSSKSNGWQEVGQQYWPLARVSDCCKVQLPSQCIPRLIAPHFKLTRAFRGNLSHVSHGTNCFQSKANLKWLSKGSDCMNHKPLSQITAIR